MNTFIVICVSLIALTLIIMFIINFYPKQRIRLGTTPKLDAIKPPKNKIK